MQGKHICWELGAFTCHDQRATTPAHLPAGMEDGERPWLKPHVHTPAAREPKPGETRKRPLIYVYDLPAIYNSIFLQVCKLPVLYQRRGKWHPASRVGGCNALWSQTSRCACRTHRARLAPFNEGGSAAGSCTLPTSWAEHALPRA